MNAQNNYTYSNAATQAADVSEIYISNFISDEFWGGFGMNAMRKDLQEAKDVKILLNSPGGSVTEGFAIADLLRLHKSKGNSVEIVGTGIVASIATMVFLSGTKGKRFLTQNAFFMIHNATGSVEGDDEELIQQAKVIKDMKELIADNYVAIIAENSKLINNSIEETKQQVLQWMKQETWFSSKAALEVGLIDGIVEDSADYITKDNVASVENSIKAFKNVPGAILNMINSVKNESSMLNTEEQNWFTKIFNKLTGKKEAATEVGVEGPEAKIQSDMKNMEVEIPEEVLVKKLQEMGYEISKPEEAMKEEVVVEEEEAVAGEKNAMVELQNQLKAMAMEVQALKEKPKAPTMPTNNLGKGMPEQKELSRKEEAMNKLAEKNEGFFKNLKNLMHLR